MKKPRTIREEWLSVQESNEMSLYFLKTKVMMHRTAIRLDKRRNPGAYVK